MKRYRLNVVRAPTTTAHLVNVNAVVDRQHPLCGSTMRVKVRDIVVQVPGNPRPTTTHSSEWVCPECDYFEDVDEEKD